MVGKRKLGTREKQIHGLVMSGIPRSELAVRLGLSKNTVRVHLFNIYNKLGIKSYKQLADRSRKAWGLQ